MHDSAAHTDHARHDLTLIAGHAAGDLSTFEAASASTLLATCPACAEVHRDLVAISSATRALPRTARAPRDFRLTADQAQRLHRGSWLRALLRPFAAAGSATRPMATAFTSIGVAGLLVAVLLPAGFGLAGGPASAPPNRDTTYEAADAATHAPAMAPTNQEVNPQGSLAAPGAAGASGDSGAYVAAGAESPKVGDPGDGDNLKANAGDEVAGTSDPPNLLLLGSAGLLAVGLALFGLRLAARRVR